MKKYQGHIVDVTSHRIFDGEVETQDGRITAVREQAVGAGNDRYIMPGFIDSHVHIESSMMLPSEFAHIAVEHGTIGIVTDPHEIANVAGIPGIDFMIESSRKARFNFCFGAPSCVPSCSTDIETSGEVLDSNCIRQLMSRPDIGCLSEMMNYPAILGNDPEVMAKVKAAHDNGKPVDGHAPGLTEEGRRKYAGAGISTDHECSTLDEGRLCIGCGMKVIIREGSAAKNYESLIPLLREHPDMVMFCTDDCHPDDLVHGHINKMVARAIADGYDLWDILQAACVNPQRHYSLGWGLLREGDPATFIVTDGMGPDMNVLATVIGGEEVFSREAGTNTVLKAACGENATASYPNKFMAKPVTMSDIALNINTGDTAHIITAQDGSLLTGHDKVEITSIPFTGTPAYPWGEVQKIVVYNRYTPDARPQVGLIRGFCIKDGAMCATIAHDCHNIVAIGSADKYIVEVINRVIAMQGGMAAVSGTESAEMPLPVAGLMSPLDAHEVARRSAEVNKVAAAAGCPFKAPFITMAFMCLPVIPALKITDKGIFDVEKWNFV